MAEKGRREGRRRGGRWRECPESGLPDLASAGGPFPRGPPRGIIIGLGNILYDLNCSAVHRLENVLTLDLDTRAKFDQLQVWFEPGTSENSYNLRSVKPYYVQHISNPTALTTRDDIPLPSPVYLALHATCARVAHLSGAGRYVDRILRDMECIPVLANDGSSAEVLNYALARIDV
ncbi:hypothetical protein B0H21DRAFT_699177 [Amylocystis lapponica]|nr:hypothetical protein B0H21DRAFT_699177 [Amylocystis lapponica]